jgi:CheY-like chemotaxis protein
MSNPVTSGAPKKILIVDDDEVVVLALQLKLESRGYKVASASDSSSAIQAITHNPPDLILLDINFPPDLLLDGGSMTWDGFAIIEWVKHLKGGNTIPVIVVTGEDTRKHAERVRSLGAVAIFRKPVDGAELLKAIQGVFESNTPD